MQYSLPTKTMSLSSSEAEILRNELQIIQHKLASKCEALLIITQELNVMRNERDQFKSLAEQIQARYGKLKKQMLLQNTAVNSVSTYAECTSTGFELEDLQMKLQDANETIRMLRNQLSVLQAGKANIERIQLRKEMEEALARTVSPRSSVSGSEPTAEESWLNEGDVVRQLEAVRIENKQLVRDLQVVLEEKEALTIERDAFRARLSRYEVDTAGECAQRTEMADLRGQLELITNENNLLTSRCRQLETDRANMLQTLSSYKQLLRTTHNVSATGAGAKSSEPETSASAASRNASSATLERPFPGLPDNTNFTLRRVKYLIDAANAAVLLEKPRDSLIELQNLARILVENVQDKQLANVHQRKINKFLAGRLHEYEERERHIVQEDASADERTSESGSLEAAAKDEIAEQYARSLAKPSVNAHAADAEATESKIRQNDS